MLLKSCGENQFNPVPRLIPISIHGNTKQSFDPKSLRPLERRKMEFYYENLKTIRYKEFRGDMQILMMRV